MSEVTNLIYADRLGLWGRGTPFDDFLAFNKFIEKRGIGHDRILFATDCPWGDFEGEYARLAAVAKDPELAQAFFRGNFENLYG